MLAGKLSYTVVVVSIVLLVALAAYLMYRAVKKDKTSNTNTNTNTTTTPHKDTFYASSEVLSQEVSSNTTH